MSDIIDFGSARLGKIQPEYVAAQEKILIGILAMLKYYKNEEQIHPHRDGTVREITGRVICEELRAYIADPSNIDAVCILSEVLDLLRLATVKSD